MLTMPNDIALPDILDAMDSVLKSQARIYMHLARVATERFGRDGERSVRLGLRAYGLWRGREMQEAHHALGKPVNMETLMRNWDNASTWVASYTIADEGPLHAQRRRVRRLPLPGGQRLEDLFGHVVRVPAVFKRGASVNGSRFAI